MKRYIAAEFNGSFKILAFRPKYIDMLTDLPFHVLAFYSKTSIHVDYPFCLWYLMI